MESPVVCFNDLEGGELTEIRLEPREEILHAPSPPPPFESPRRPPPIHVYRSSSLASQRPQPRPANLAICEAEERALESPAIPARPRRRSYLEYAVLGSKRAPEYQSLLRTVSAPDKVDVVVLEVDEDPRTGPPHQRVFRDAEMLGAYIDECSTPPGPEVGIKMRYFLVEDLSTSTIETLGAGLKLPLAFFAAQLDGSYDSRNNKTRCFPSLSTMAPVEGCTVYSVPWRRVVYWHTALSQGLDMSLYDSGNVGRSRHDLTVDAKSNVSPLSFAERVSVLRMEWGGCETVVVLFDSVFGRQDLYTSQLRRESFLDLDGREHWELKNRRTRIYASEPSRLLPDLLSYSTILQEEKAAKHLDELDSCNPGFRKTLLNMIAMHPTYPYIHSALSFDLALYHAILHDWESVVMILEESLDQVEARIIDLNSVEDHLSESQEFLGTCRRRMATYEREIACARQELDGIVDRWIRGSDVRDKTADRLHSVLRRIETRACQLHKRVERSYSALMTSMSILESQKGITQAASINRLSELAFLFIPLTFVSSIFSMQVSGVSTSLSIWALVSVLLTFFTYGLRIIHRSWTDSTSLLWVKDTIRKGRQYRPTESPRTTDYLRFLWTRPFELWGVLRKNTVAELGFRAFTILRFLAVALLAGCIFVIWFLGAQDLGLFAKISLSLLVFSCLLFVVLGIIMRPGSSPPERLTRRQVRIFVLLQGVRWCVLFTTWLGVVPVTLLWTEGKDMPLGGRVVLTVLCVGLMTLACWRSVWLLDLKSHFMREVGMGGRMGRDKLKRTGSLPIRCVGPGQ